MRFLVDGDLPRSTKILLQQYKHEAAILHGYYRTTHDIDLLVDSSIENIRRLKKALQEIFKSDEISEIRDVDIDQYAVVRFAPESEEIVIGMIGINLAV